MLMNRKVMAIPVLVAFVQTLKFLEIDTRIVDCRSCQSRETDREVGDVISYSCFSSLDGS